MIGLDTNVILRFITRDDEGQWQRTHDLMGRHEGETEELYISDLALCEVAWVLRSSYKYTKTEQVEELAMLSEVEEFKFSDRAIFKQAIELYKNGKADFSDYFIILKNKQVGCEYT